jgi:hypothetical protein
VDFGDKYPEAHRRVNADRLRSDTPATATPRFRDQDALPPIASGAQHPKILDLVGRQRARGRPRHNGRPHFLYRVRFPDLDHHYDVWLTEKTLRQRYPGNADLLIHSFDEQADQ